MIKKKDHKNRGKEGRKIQLLRRKSIILKITEKERNNTFKNFKINTNTTKIAQQNYKKK